MPAFILVIAALTLGPMPIGTASAATPSFIQQAYADPQTNQTTVVATYTKAQLAGDTNIVAVGWNNTTSNINSVSDTKGNIYVLAAPVTRGNGMSQALYYAKNIVSAAANANTVTVTFNTSTAYVDLRVTEYSGLDPASPFDQTASATGSGTVASTAAVTTRYSNELIFGAGMTNANFSTSGSGFTTRVITAPDADIVFDKTVSSIGSYNVSATQSGSWILQMATFRVAGAAADTTAPSVPGGLSGTAVSSTQINLGWTASTDSVGVTGYKIFRNGAQIATTAATTYQDTGVVRGTAYSYNVAAYDAAGNTSALSNTATVTTPNPRHDGPHRPCEPRRDDRCRRPRSTSVGQRAPTPSASRGTRFSAMVFRSRSPSLPRTRTRASRKARPTPTRVSAYDAAGNSSAQSAGASATTQASSDTSPPSVPTGLTATAASSTAVDLSWTASTDNVGVTGYRIYRGGALVTTTSGASYTDSGLTSATTYSYNVAAYDAAANVSAQSAGGSRNDVDGIDVELLAVIVGEPSISGRQPEQALSHHGPHRVVHHVIAEHRLPHVHR